MEIHLTDLDALLLKVREHRSRDHMREAINAYKMGAYNCCDGNLDCSDVRHPNENSRDLASRR